MMIAPRILIVDDQREVTRVLRSGLESLEAELVVDDVLSGEEAILEFGRDMISLLISDIRLPGINGFELMERFKKHNPEGKVILVSGVPDTKTRKQVAQAGADAFFFKPVEMADFLDSVERVLGMVDSVLPQEMELAREQAAEEDEQQAKGMSERIADLRKELNASSITLIGEMGQTLVRAGTLPDPEVESVLLPGLLPALSAGFKAAQYLKTPQPNNVMYFEGSKLDVFLAQVGDSYGLLITVDPVDKKKLSGMIASILIAVKDVLHNLMSLGVAVSVSSESAPRAPTSKAVEPEPELLPTDPELEDLFAKAGDVKPSDADAFWESTASKATTATFAGSDSLSYEEARQLGLTPDEEE